MGIPLTTVEWNDHGGGLDLISSPTKTPDDNATLSLNVDYSTDGAVFTRNGSTILNSGHQMTSDLVTYGIYDFWKSNGSHVQVINAGTTIKHSLTNPVNAVTGLTAAIPCFEIQVTADDEYLFWGNGLDTNLKFDGTTWTNWSIPRAAPPTFATINAGAGVLAAGTYTYYREDARTVAGTIVQVGELSIAGTHTIAPGDAPADIQVNIPVAADTQVNARVIYRVKIASSIAYRLTAGPTVSNNTATTYDDVLAEADLGAYAEAEYDNQAAPKSSVFAEFGGQMYMRDDARKTDFYIAKAYKPWNVPTNSLTIADGRITCMKRFYNYLVIGTERSIWTMSSSGDFNKISSKVGIVNNRCADGEASLYIMGTNRKIYRLTPTDLLSAEIDLSNPVSQIVDRMFDQIGGSAEEYIALKYFTKPNVSKLVIAAPEGASTNSQIIVFNEKQSIVKGKPVWQKWDNLKASAIQVVRINRETILVSGDYNGFLWKLDDDSTNGDGAEVNGTATSGGASTIIDTSVLDETGTSTAGLATTLEDTSKTWTVNEWLADEIYVSSGPAAGDYRVVAGNTANTITVTLPWTAPPGAGATYSIGGFPVDDYIGMNVTIVEGTGEGQKRVISANDDDTLTVSVPWTDALDDTSEYSVGGYDHYHYTNWKFVTGSYETLSQLWFLWVNANASGDYNIKMIMQLDFDTTLTNQVEILINLKAENTIWGAFIWGAAVWGSHSVFLDRFRHYARFRAVRFGFYHRLAGQPWQINNLGASAQDRGLMFQPM